MTTSAVCNILSKEITPIPTWIKTVLGDFYDNTLCNEATWMVVLWRILHIIHNNLTQAYLKQVGFKHYICSRLARGFWFLGFYSAALAYYLATFDGNSTVSFKKSSTNPTDNLSTQMILAYTVICSFYIHTAFSEGVQMGSLYSFIKFLLLVVVCITAYILRFMDIPFSLTALIGISALSEDLTRIFYLILNQENTKNYNFVGVLYVFSLILFTVTHLAAIPIIFVIPLGKRIISGEIIIVLLVLFLSLLLWLIITIYNSILINSIFHWLYHTKNKLNKEESGSAEDKGESSKNITECPGNLFECSLFPRRTDDAYVLKVLRSEANKRKERMVAKRKPKNRNMIIQTLKCMMVIRKKLSEKRMSDNSDSDDSVESDDAIEDNKESKNIDEDVEKDEDDDDVEVSAEDLEVENNVFHNTLTSSDTDLVKEDGDIKIAAEDLRVKNNMVHDKSSANTELAENNMTSTVCKSNCLLSTCNLCNSENSQQADTCDLACKGNTVANLKEKKCVSNSENSNYVEAALEEHNFNIGEKET